MLMMNVVVTSDGGKYLIKTASMNGSKRHPIVFVAQDKIYILEDEVFLLTGEWENRFCLPPPSDTQFEVFCPREKRWRVLPPQPHGYQGVGTVYVVVGKTVYFVNNMIDALLCFDLEVEKWIVLKRDISPVVWNLSSAFPLPPNLSFYESRGEKYMVTHGTSLVAPNLSFNSPLPASPLVVVGGMAFGFTSAGVQDEDDDSSLTIGASPLPHSGDSIKREFLRPSIAADDEFLQALESSRYPHVVKKSDEFFSEYMVALDGGKVLCHISYGSDLAAGGDPFNPDTSYASLTFFEVTLGFYLGESRHNVCNVNHASETIDEEYVPTRYFKAKLLRSAQFIIKKTTSLRGWGGISTCFS